MSLPRLVYELVWYVNVLCLNMYPPSFVLSKLMLGLYILEYASCVWSPSYTTAIKLIESVQRKFTKRLPGYSHLDYASRLDRLEMESLELRRLHTDLIQTYKILFGLTSITASEFFSFPNPIHNTRGHAYKLFENHYRINVQQHFFAERVIKPWNSLQVAPHDFNSLNSFRTCLRSNDLSKFLVFTRLPNAV